MKAKTFVTGILLAFVAASVVYLVVKETGAHKQQATSDEPLPASVANWTTATTGQQVIAYYFFGNVRCQTCKKIEAYTSETIAAFTNELSTGLLEWRTANTDEREHEHFVKDYELTSRSVVLVRMMDGKQVEWKNLPLIWDLVKDKSAFQEYISEETQIYLRTGSK